jgi:hypothetical protein
MWTGRAKRVKKGVAPVKDLFPEKEPLIIADPNPPGEERELEGMINPSGPKGVLVVIETVAHPTPNLPLGPELESVLEDLKGLRDLRGQVDLKELIEIDTNLLAESIFIFISYTRDESRSRSRSYDRTRKSTKRESASDVYDAKYFLNLITTGKQRHPSGVYERLVEQKLQKMLVKTKH